MDTSSTRIDCWASFGAGMARTPLLGVAPNKRMLLIGLQPTIKKMLGANTPRPLLEQLRRCSLNHDVVATMVVEPVTMAFSRLTGKSTDDLLKAKDGEKYELLIRGMRSAELTIDFRGENRPSTDRRDWAKISATERMAHAKRLLILHPRFREAVALLEHCHQASRQASKPVCGALLRALGDPAWSRGTVQTLSKLGEGLPLAENSQ